MEENVFVFKYKEQCEEMDLFLTLPNINEVAYGFVDDEKIFFLSTENATLENAWDILHETSRRVKERSYEMTETAVELFNQGIEPHIIARSKLNSKAAVS